MNWSSVQMNAAVIAGLVSLSISLIVALVAIILANRRGRHNFNLEFAAEGVAREMLTDRKWPYYPFRVLKYHLTGFSDDELRRRFNSEVQQRCIDDMVEHRGRGKGRGQGRKSPAAMRA